MSTSPDIFISGGGVAGLTAACLFGSAGYRVSCAEPIPPVTMPDRPGTDLRSTAFLQPSIALLEKARLWSAFAPHATPLHTMRIVDASGPDSSAVVTRAFHSRDISEQPFGWNIPNWLIRRELIARLEELQNVEFLSGVSCTGLLQRTNVAKIRLSDHTTRTARLVIAADGRGSFIRTACGIKTHRISYGQKALAFTVTHTMPHENVSTEIHRTGGPFTLVPLPDHAGKPASAVVWLERADTALRLSQMHEAEFNAAISERSSHILGALQLCSARSLWPILSQIAHNFASERVALVAEAAHVMPPIGAQGLNTSLADIDLLFQLAQRHSLGSAGMLAAYDKKRRHEVAFRGIGVDVLNRVSMGRTPWLHGLRAQGIKAIHDLPFMRKTVMKLGLGAH